MADHQLQVGQQVVYSCNRWTPDGWEPIEIVGTIINPCVTNDPNYNGDVELDVEGELSRTFVSSANIRLVETLAENVTPLANENAIAAQQHVKHIVGPTILMGDGAYFDFESPDASGMSIEDYAWGLAANGRFRGQTRYPAIDAEGWSPRCLYNVCQHVVLMSDQMLLDGHSAQAAFEGLMHESDEVVWGDFPGPAKSLMPAEFRALVKRAGDAIDERFGVTRTHKDLVKQYDLRMLATEKRNLMPHASGDQWEGTGNYAPFPWRIACWDAETSVRQFLHAYEMLRRTIDA